MPADRISLQWHQIVQIRLMRYNMNKCGKMHPQQTKQEIYMEDLLAELVM